MALDQQIDFNSIIARYISLLRQTAKQTCTHSTHNDPFMANAVIALRRMNVWRAIIYDATAQNVLRHTI